MHLLIKGELLLVTSLDNHHSHGPIGTLSRPKFSDEEKKDLAIYRKMKGNSANIAIIINEERRLTNNNSIANHSFILAKNVRNNSGKAQLNKLNDFVDNPFFKFLSPVNDISGSLIGYIIKTLS